MQEAAPLFARHPYARDAPSVPRQMLEAAAPGQTDGPAAGAPAGPGRLRGRGGPGGAAMRRGLPAADPRCAGRRSKNGCFTRDRGASRAGRTAAFPAGQPAMTVSQGEPGERATGAHYRRTRKG